MIEAGSLIRSLSGRPAARNFHTYVINEIGIGIVTGRYPVGSILPNDAEMMESFGVSRTVLREALKTIEAKGLIEARPKVGTRVSPTSRWNLLDSQVLSWHIDARPDRKFYDSLFDIRHALERRAVELSCQHRTAEQIRAMKYWGHQMALSEDNGEGHALACLEIHCAIAESSGNPLLRSVNGVVELTLALAVRGHPAEPGQRYRRPAVDEHSALILAIERSDTITALTHLETILQLDQTDTLRNL